MCGVALPPGLKNASQLPEPIFTPATKAETRRARREHQLRAHAARSIGARAGRAGARRLDPPLQRRRPSIALTKGIIIADTKFEFGLDEDGTLTLMDEVLTPDSSRFWPRDHAQAVRGRRPPSYDKQFVRDWLEQGRREGRALEQDGAGTALPPR